MTFSHATSVSMQTSCITWEQLRRCSKQHLDKPVIYSFFKQQNRRKFLIKVKGNNWCDVRQEHKKSWKKCVQDGYKTGHGVGQNVGQLERRRHYTQLKCACCGGKDERKTRQVLVNSRYNKGGQRSTHYNVPWTNIYPLK